MRGAADQESDAAGDEVPELDDGAGDRIGRGRHDAKLGQAAQKQQRGQTEKTDEGGTAHLQAESRLLRRLQLRRTGFLRRFTGGKTDLCPGRAVLYRTGPRFQYMRLGGLCRLSAVFLVANKIGAEEVAENGGGRGADHDVDLPGYRTVSGGEKEIGSGLDQQDQHEEKQALVHRMDAAHGGPPGGEMLLHRASLLCVCLRICIRAQDGSGRGDTERTLFPAGRAVGGIDKVIRQT